MTDGGRRLALAQHYLAVGRPADALRTIEQTGSIEDELEWVVVAESLRRLERVDEAADAARRGLAAWPDSPPLLEVLALAEEDRGDLAAAERAVRTALDLVPDDPALLCRYGHLLAHAGLPDEAKRLADEAERVAPGDADVARLRMAIAYIAHGRAAAAAVGTELLAADPEDAAAHRSLAVRAGERGDVRRALRHMEEVVRRDPTDAEAAEVARDFRIESHWLFVPLWPFRRFGPWRVWGLMWLTVIPASVLSPALGASLLLVYIALVVYSWLVPPFVRAVLRRRSR